MFSTKMNFALQPSKSFDNEDEDVSSTCYSSSSDYDSSSDDEDEWMKDMALELLQHQQSMKRNGIPSLDVIPKNMAVTISSSQAALPDPTVSSTRRLYDTQKTSVYIQQDTPMTDNHISDSNKSSSKTSSTIKTPQDTLNEILQDLSLPQQASALEQEGYWNKYFLPVTAERQCHYSLELTKAVRAIDLQALQAVAESSGNDCQWMNACNRQGESLVHVACRRSHVPLLEFFLQQGATLQVRDEYSKTPLHDACWTASPNFEMIDIVLKEAPALLFVKDFRGFTPLDYIPRDCYPAWNTFLQSQASSLRLAVQYLSLERARHQLHSSHQKLHVLLQDL